MLRLVKDGLTFKDAGHQAGVTLSARECLENLFAALEDTIKKIISKMGITTIEGYRGAQLFEAVGFGPELMEFLGDFPAASAGIGLQELVEDAAWRVEQAEKMSRRTSRSARTATTMAFNAKVRMALRDAVKEAHPGAGDRAAARWPTPPRRRRADPDAPEPRRPRSSSSSPTW